MTIAAQNALLNNIVAPPATQTATLGSHVVTVSISVSSGSQAAMSGATGTARPPRRTRRSPSAPLRIQRDALYGDGALRSDRRWGDRGRPEHHHQHGDDAHAKRLRSRAGGRVIRVAHRMAKLRQRLQEQEGMTLVELVVAMSILSIAMVILLSTLTSIQKASVNENVRSTTINQARLAMQTIDRQVRSGNLLYPPNAAGYTFLIYTQAYSAQDDISRCALWTVNSQKQLMYAYWKPNITPGALTWQVVADGIINRAQSQGAFTLDSTGRTMTVLFLVNSSPRVPDATQTLQTSVTGRTLLSAIRSPSAPSCPRTCQRDS